MSLCSILNARSARTKGLQLLMGMMLMARATSRQVQCFIIFIRTDIPVQMYTYGLASYYPRPWAEGIVVCLCVCVCVC